MKELRQILLAIDSKPYPLYKRAKGSFQFGKFELTLAHIQGDPFAAPSKLVIRIPLDSLPIENRDALNPSRRTGYEDALLRSFAKTLRKFGHSRGSGKSGYWGLLQPGQVMLPRTALELSQGFLILRFTAGLPASGRRILGKQASEMLTDELVKIVDASFFTQSDVNVWHQHANLAEDQNHLREVLLERGWIAFIANGSRLARLSGIDERPLPNSVPWASPPELEEQVELPHAGKIMGSAIQKGVTLICGGGYHGKSTVLQALSRGVYNHIPGDGREFCLCSDLAVAIRAEDGRSISNVDISPFITNLPSQLNTKDFSTQNASGSTSQAANIVESLEMGANCLLIDEDTSATNFMVRDRRMQELIATDMEPITPFIDRIRELYQKFQLSTVLVIGGLGEYFDVCDEVIVMQNYIPTVKTKGAKQLSNTYPAQRLKESRPPISDIQEREVRPDCFDPQRGKRRESVRSHKTRTLSFGEEEIELSFLSQLIEPGQAHTIGDWLLNCSKERKPTLHLKRWCGNLVTQCPQLPLSSLIPNSDNGDRVWVRRFELAAAINRYRALSIRTH